MCNHQFLRCAPTDSHPVFGTLDLLKWKANEMAANAPPLTPLSPLPLPVSQQPHHDHELIDQMCRLLQSGACCMDVLQGAQMASQEASGLMGTAMLRQQGEMREVLAWESEVESAMREMARVVEEEEPGL